MSTRARARSFTIGGISFETPLFMPVGTRASVRGQQLDDLADLGFPILLANTFHLGLRPGPDLLLKAKGVAKWMDWAGGILTDSGGYQVFSLADNCVVEEAGALFKDVVSGKRVHLTPERSMEWQHAIGSNIRMVMDQCVCSTVDFATAKEAMERTHRWAERSLQAHAAYADGSALFGIVQGACFTDLRKISANFLSSLPFGGFAIGGLAVGESREQREDITDFTMQFMPEDRPRYLMGVGTPIDLLEAVHRGVDMFDCIIPTAMAQHSTAYTSRGKIDMKRGVYRFSEEPLDPACDCRTCRKFSRSYLHHLVRVGECMGWQHLAHHNFAFYRRLMLNTRQEIQAGTFESFYSAAREYLAEVDLDNPPKLEKPKKVCPPVNPVYASSDAEFEVVARGGSWSMKETSSGEVMHPGDEGGLESERLYVQQPGLKEILETPGETVVIWDVGLGVAANAMAAVRCWETSNAVRNVVVVSIDNTKKPFEIAIQNQQKFPHLWHSLPSRLLAERRVKALHPNSGQSDSPASELEWIFIEADFMESLPELPAPRLIFYDPYSNKSNPTLWTEPVFRQIFDAVKDYDCELITYSNSTSVRTALLLGGFFVCRGEQTGFKTETTIALTAPAYQNELRKRDALKKDWLGRWERSSAFQPPLSTQTRDELAPRLFSHPQFS